MAEYTVKQKNETVEEMENIDKLVMRSGGKSRSQRDYT